jgi:two-component system chemotaxis response regulator CheB
MEKDDLIDISKCVVIGGSAGCLKVLLRIIPKLSPDLCIPIIIVIHRKNDRKSSLDQLLNYRTSLIVQEAEDKVMLKNGRLYIAPPDYHLLIEKDHSLSLDGSEKVLWSRPSIDVTFQSAAEIFGEKVLGILLSGANNDGASGLKSIKKAGGTTIIQHPDNAEISVMPLAALNLLQPDYLLKDEEIAAVINNF